MSEGIPPPLPLHLRVKSVTLDLNTSQMDKTHCIRVDVCNAPRIHFLDTCLSVDKSHTKVDIDRLRNYVRPKIKRHSSKRHIEHHDCYFVSPYTRHRSKIHSVTVTKSNFIRTFPLLNFVLSSLEKIN